jgi:hypothetical protein
VREGEGEEEGGSEEVIVLVLRKEVEGKEKRVL